MLSQYSVVGPSLLNTNLPHIYIYIIYYDFLVSYKIFIRSTSWELVANLWWTLLLEYTADPNSINWNYGTITMLSLFKFTLRELESSHYYRFICITYTIVKKYYPGKSVKIHMWSLINTIQNWSIGKLPPIMVKWKLLLFRCNRERMIPFYAKQHNEKIT